MHHNLFEEDNSSHIVSLDASSPKEEQYTITVELLEKVAEKSQELLTKSY